MKKLLSFLLTLAILNIVSVSCERQEKDPPELPPYESMAIDFSKFTVEDEVKGAFGDKSTQDGTREHYNYAAFNVAVFNIILTATLVVPVAAFATAVHHQPVFIGDATWEWSYTVDGFASSYTARLTGQVRSNDVLWEMYISKSGVGAFDEFKWYEGTSLLDGTGGQWILYQSYIHPEALLQIDWERNGAEMGTVKYTNVQVLTNNGAPNEGYGSYIEAGKTDDPFMDAFYNIHLAESNNDVFIEWSTTEYYGRVMSESWFGPGWNCWDNYGYDIECNE